VNLVRSVFSKLSPMGSRSRLSVFIFHRVLPQPDPIFPSEVDAVRFDQMMCWVKDWFDVMPLDQAVTGLKSATLPARAAAISFDDGYADNFAVALPILQRHGLSSTFFIATGFLDGGRMWNDTIIESIRACAFATLDLSTLGLGAHNIRTPDEKRLAIAALIRQIKYLPVAIRIDMTEKIAQVSQVDPPRDLMMTSGQVREMDRAGMQIGAHTVTHPILAGLDLQDARQEIADSKACLEHLLGHRVGLFAYPNGKPGADYLSEHATLVRELGFDGAFSTAAGTANLATDVYQIPRFTPWDRSYLRFGVRLMRNLRSQQQTCAL